MTASRSVRDCDDTEIRVLQSEAESRSKLVDERWANHRREHDQIAEALKQYKSDSNEWRGTISDLRGNLVNRDMLQSFQDRADSEHLALDKRLDAVEKALLFFQNRETGGKEILTAGRALLLTVISIAGFVISVLLFIQVK